MNQPNETYVYSFLPVDCKGGGAPSKAEMVSFGEDAHNLCLAGYRLLRCDPILKNGSTDRLLYVFERVESNQE